MSYSISQRIFSYFILLVSCLVVPLIISLMAAKIAGAKEAAALGMIIGVIVVHVVFAHKFLNKRFAFNLVVGISTAIVVITLGIIISQSEPLHAFARQFFTKDVFINRILRPILVHAILAIFVWELVYWIIVASTRKRTTAANTSLLP